MSNNFVTVEKAYFSDLIRSKSRLETILDCLLEGYIHGYKRYDASELYIDYCENQIGVEKSEPVGCKEDLFIRSTPKIKVNGKEYGIETVLTEHKGE